tara:strand:+ start:1598 stop:2662 length:1065 start_codon:yes stop_codon:yes gene_type:complete
MKSLALSEIEPNNNLAEGQFVDFGIPIKGSLSDRSDEDWFQVELGASSYGSLNVHIETRLLGIYGILVSIHREDGETITQVDCYSRRCVDFALVVRIEKSGGYYVRVQNADDATEETGEYTLTFNYASAPSSGTVYLQTTSNSENISLTHVLNTADFPQTFSGTLFASDGTQLGAASQPLHVGIVSPNGRIVLSSEDIEAAFTVSPWIGPAVLDVHGTGTFELMTKLESPSGFVSNTNCVRRNSAHNIGGFDQSTLTYVRFINVGDQTINQVLGSLYDQKGNLIGQKQQIFINSLAGRAQTWISRDQFSNIVGDTWNGTATLKIIDADENLRLLNLNRIENETFLNFSCYEAGS